MKTKFYTISLLLTLSFSARASVYIFSGTPTDNGAGPGVIPDNSTIGLAESLTISDLPGSIVDVTLSLTMTGGFATDLTGYLRLGNLTGSPFYDLTTAVQAQTFNASTPVTFNVDVTSAFSGLNGNDTWTVFFADNSPGGVTTLNGWSLDITPVPEPVNVALVIFGLVVGGVTLSRHLAAKSAVKSPRNPGSETVKR